MEAKDIGKSLDKAERSEQLQRCRRSLGDIILTDHAEFRWYMGGEHQCGKKPSKRWPSQSDINSK
jgi:hypothetical protein